jgi:flagellar biogenesis protein FliO
MSNTVQWITIAVLFIFAMVYLFRRMQTASKGKACQGDACGCKPAVKESKIV